jgi:hypothetical protein
MTVTSVPDWKRPRARVAALSRSRDVDDPDLVAARRDLKAARLAEYIQRTVEAAPPLSDEQREHLVCLLTPNLTGGGLDGAA